jgi:hypothetical protein
MIQTQTIHAEGRCNISPGTKNNHYPARRSDQDIFREPVFCWGHNSKSLVPLITTRRLSLLPHRNTQAKRCSNIHALRKSSAPARRGHAQCCIQHSTTCPRSIFICCAPLYRRISAHVLGRRKVSQLFTDCSMGRFH